MIDWIYGHDPYAGFPLADWPPEVVGWNADSPIFAHAIAALPADCVIIEVGTWKGASALNMARMMRDRKIPDEMPTAERIICVDTWLGGPELHTGMDLGAIPMANGRPMLYEQFIANVIHTGLQGVIVPFPADSLTAASVLRAKGVLADAIYIDAAHDYDHVSADLRAYWPLLRAGGLFFGDDYGTGAWPGVDRAVNEFAYGLSYQVATRFPGKWLISKRKPKEHARTSGPILEQQPA